MGAASRLRLRGWLRSLQALSISSLKEKWGFLQDEEKQNSCLKAKVVKLQEKDMQGWAFPRGIVRLLKNMGSGAKERFHDGIQSKGRQLQVLKYHSKQSN